jgi:transketolase
MASEALQAASALEAQDVSAAVIDPVTIKPLDTQCLLTWAKHTGAVVTAENCNVHGGLGDAVASMLAENYPVIMERVGVQDEFGEVGTVDYLQTRFGLTSQEIIEKVTRVLERK